MRFLLAPVCAVMAKRYTAGGKFQLPLHFRLSLYRVRGISWNESRKRSVPVKGSRMGLAAIT